MTPFGPTPVHQITSSGMMSPVFGTATVDTLATPAFTLTGCAASAPTMARTPTNYFMIPRTRFMSSVSTSAAFLRVEHATRHLYPNGATDGVGQWESVSGGQFSVTIRFGVGDASYSQSRRGFIGLTAANLTNADPATYTNVIGVGHNNNGLWNVYYGGSVAQTPISTGFNNTTAQREVYELVIWSGTTTTTAPDNSFVYPYMGLTLTRQATQGYSKIAKSYALYGLPEVLPRENVSLGFGAMRANIGVSGSIGYDFFGYSWESWV